MLRRAAKRLAADQRGFTLVMVITALMAVSLMSVAAWTAAVNDVPVAAADQQARTAYEAAQAGVDWYASLLRNDPEGWMKCGADTAAVPKWRPVTKEGLSNGWLDIATGAQATAGGGPRFRIEILNTVPAGGGPAVPCDPDKPFTTALDPKGYLRIRSTGAIDGRARSVVAVFQQQSDFLKYVYFSNWEAQDPQVTSLPNPDAFYPATSNRNQCDYTRKVRDRTANPGYPSALSLSCFPHAVQTNDTLAGSVRTNDDSVFVCNGAVFGRSGRDDKLEVASPDEKRWNANSKQVVGGANANPDYKTAESAFYDCAAPSFSTDKKFSNVTVDAKAEVLQLPPNNIELKKYADDGTGGWPLITGRACLAFTADGGVDVWTGADADWGITQGINCTGTPTFHKASLPDGGVIYARNDPNVPCVPRYGKGSATSYTSSASCGDIAVKGTYSGSVTLGAENDIIITGNVTRDANSDALLGLIANGFVRIYHPLKGDPYLPRNQEDGFGKCGSTLLPWGAGYTPVTEIQAAVLSMQHTLQLDNLFCGSIPKLTLEGSVSVYWAAFNKFDPGWTWLPAFIRAFLGATPRGYLERDWKHDDRLRTGSPPHFIAPLNSDARWTIQRRTEQSGTPVPWTL